MKYKYILSILAAITVIVITWSYGLGIDFTAWSKIDRGVWTSVFILSTVFGYLLGLSKDVQNIKNKG